MNIVDVFDEVNKYKLNFAMEIANVILKRQEEIFRRTSNIFNFSDPFLPI